MIQASLNFETAKGMARRSDPLSSKRAAQDFVASGADRSHEQIIIDTVRQFPGRTAIELSALCGLTEVQINRRGKKMEKKGLIRRISEGSKDLKWWPV